MPEHPEQPELDTSQIGIVAAKLMDELADEFPDGTIEAVGVICDVSFENEEEEDSTCVRWKFNKADGTALSFAHQRGIAEFMAEAFTDL